MSQQTGHWGISVAIRTDREGATSRRGPHTSQTTHRAGTRAPATQGRDQPTSASARIWSPTCCCNKVLLETPCHHHSSFPRETLEVDAPAPPPRQTQAHRIQSPRPPTSSFRSSDSRALRSSSFRMIALSSAILSWKRRASFSSNCCS